MSDQILVEIATALGRVEGKLDEALKADRERISKIEKTQTRQWWVSVAIAPFLTLAQHTARKFGVQI